MLRKLIFLFFILPVVLLSHSALAINKDSESITHFDSFIIVNKNASIDVIENITVEARALQIQRGIIRSLPTQYKDSYGIEHQATYQVKDILLNQTASPYHTEYRGNRLAVIIGDKDIFLKPGTYTYTIAYHVADAVNFLRDGDELYWNITGNEWTFPILKATVTVQLPEGAKVLSSAGYTGRLGEKGKDFSVTHPSANEIKFTTTGELPPGSGLTIAVAWPKGFVTAPSFLAKVGPSIYFILALGLGIFIYYFQTWKRYGKDPKKGTIIPRFEAPENLSPAAMRYIMHMGSDAKTFTTAIISMATKGFLKIQNKNDIFTLIKNKEAVTLAPEEEAISQVIFPKSLTSLTIIQSNHEKIQRAKDELKKSLLSTYKTTYFTTNTKYFLKGAFLSLFAFAIAILFSYDKGEALFAIVWLSGWSVGSVVLAFSAYKAIKSVLGYFTFKGAFQALTMSLFALPFLLGEIFGFYFLSNALPPFVMPVLFGIIALNIIFYYLLKAPTPAGRKLMDEIEGFKLFLGTTERYRLEQFHPPKETPESFEKYLPYAIALDVENQWGENFNALVQQSGQAPSQYQPVWYTGQPWTTSSLSQFPARLNAGLLTAVTAASISSTSISSSASGGGGSSGGGGGGGGGSGW